MSRYSQFLVTQGLELKYRPLFPGGLGGEKLGFTKIRHRGFNPVRPLSG